jgi:hypothetical protein
MTTNLATLLGVGNQRADEAVADLAGTSAERCGGRGMSLSYWTYP